MSLYLHVRCPPIISLIKSKREVGQKTVEIPAKELRTHTGDRYVHWIPFAHPQKRNNYKNDIRAVAESSYFKIQFPAGSVRRKERQAKRRSRATLFLLQLKQCVHIIGRLYAATRKPVEIRGVKVRIQSDHIEQQKASEHSRIWSFRSRVNSVATKKILTATSSVLEA